MRTVNVLQGTPEWAAHRAAHFNASEAAAVMNAAKYQPRTRDDLLLSKLGIVKDSCSDFQIVLFERGHEAEQSARAIIEAEFGIELFPATGVEEIDGLPLSASFDGITMDERTVFEHKLFNKELVEQVRAGELEPHYYWQLEHQAIVSGADRVIFVCSDGTRENMHIMEYQPSPERQAELLKGWRAFKRMMDEYAPPSDEAVAAAKELAELRDQIDALTWRANELEEILRAEAERARRSVVVPGFKISYQEIREKQAMTPAQFIKAQGLEIPRIVLDVPEVKTVIRRVKTD